MIRDLLTIKDSSHGGFAFLDHPIINVEIVGTVIYAKDISKNGNLHRTMYRIVDGTGDIVCTQFRVNKEGTTMHGLQTFSVGNLVRIRGDISGYVSNFNKENNTIPKKEILISYICKLDDENLSVVHVLDCINLRLTVYSLPCEAKRYLTALQECESGCLYCKVLNRESNNLSLIQYADNPLFAVLMKAALCLYDVIHSTNGDVQVDISKLLLLYNVKDSNRNNGDFTDEQMIGLSFSLSLSNIHMYFSYIYLDLSLAYFLFLSFFIPF